MTASRQAGQHSRRGIRSPSPVGADLRSVRLFWDEVDILEPVLEHETECE